MPSNNALERTEESWAASGRGTVIVAGRSTASLGAMDAPSNTSNNSANVFVGVAVAIILASMASGWLLRALLLRTLRNRHPREFAELGYPSSRRLGSLLPRYGEMQIQFWRLVWGGKVFLMKDNLASGLASAALISDVALGAGVVLLLWAAGK